jgi:diguanylate cyclase (GGDEF)-like protein
VAPIRRRDGRILGAVLVFRDATEARRIGLQMAHQATHDALTGLVNREEFEHRLKRVMETTRIQEADHALCYLDLDQFKVINDTCGHAAGDELLRQVGRLLKQHVRERDTLARLGGDEFGLLMEHCTLKQAERVAKAVRAALEGFRFLWDNKTFSIGVSIGLVPITENGDGLSGVVRAADTACYAAKENGGNRIHVFGKDDPELAQRHGVTQWVARINRALEEGRFCLYFQPIRPVVSSEMQGAHYELLLRMKDEEGHIVLPGAFLPAAERYDLATKLDGWVIHAMFEWLICHREHLEQLYLCEINLSGHSLSDDEFLRTVIREFDETNIPAEKICFEVTETAAIANLTKATHFIQTLKARGCRFALDDFGSGLSSFAYLKNLPVDFLKIDGVFVKSIVNDPTDLAMVKSINEIGHTMGKRTIAEFVESAAILRKLKLPEIGVDFAQGYHIGRPRPIADM